MSLTRDREPVEVWMWDRGGLRWVSVCRYIVHKDEWLTCVHPRYGRTRYVKPNDWRKVNP